jgi:hypothetical protein
MAVTHLRKQAQLLVVIVTMIAILLGYPSRAKALVLFSPVDGIVTQAGRPVMGATITRSYDWAWGNEQNSDSTVSNSMGHFSFPGINGRSWTASFIPHEPVITQIITIEVMGQRYEAWMLSKHNYDLNGELQGKPINLLCEILKQPMRYETHYGLCTLR